MDSSGFDGVFGAVTTGELGVDGVGRGFVGGGGLADPHCQLGGNAAVFALRRAGFWVRLRWL